MQDPLDRPDRSVSLAKLRGAWLVLAGRARPIMHDREGLRVFVSLDGETYGSRVEPPYTARTVHELSRALDRFICERYGKPVALMGRRYRVEIDDPTLLAGYIVTPVEAENDVEAEKIAARVVCDRDDRANDPEDVARFGVATQLGGTTNEPIAAFYRLPPGDLLKFERIDVDEKTFECSSGYCGWDPRTGDPHTCPMKAPAVQR